MREIKKGLKVLFLTLFAYLFQVCAMQYLEINSVTASLPFATLAVFVVSLGKKYAFCGSCIIGILMECMLSNVPAMYAIAYPVITMICAQIFADLTDRQRERRIADYQGKGFISRMRQKEAPSLLRIPMCAMVMDLIWHIVMCIYMYLIGVEINMVHISRLISGVLYTGALAVMIMLPMRYFLGMYRRKKKQRNTDDEDFFPSGKVQDTQAEEEMQEADEAPEADLFAFPSQMDEETEMNPEEGEWE